MARKAQNIILSNADINDLLSLSTNSQDSNLARRAKVILECANGLSNKEVSAITGMNEADVGRWRKVYLADGIDGLRGKHPGGNTRADAPDEDFYQKLDELLAQDDKTWTVQDLVREMKSTVNIVSAALRDRGVNLQRQRQWIIQTKDELIPKTVDVIGLYLAKTEQAVVVRCTQNDILECRGEFVTRNRELADDYLHYEGEISLAEAINMAVHHVKDTTRMVPISLTEFLHRTLAVFPVNDGYEYHILLCSTKSKGYQGNRLKGIYQFWADTPEQWLQLVNGKVHELADRSQLHSISNLQSALNLYLDKCIETTAPLIWRKMVIQPSVVKLSGEEIKPDGGNVLQFENGLMNSPFLNELRALIRRHLGSELQNSEVIRCGFISFAYDQNEVRVQMEDDNGLLPDTSHFDFSTLESFAEGVTAIEKSLVNTRNRAGVHAAEMVTDLLKKRMPTD